MAGPERQSKRWTLSAPFFFVAGTRDADP